MDLQSTTLATDLLILLCLQYTQEEYRTRIIMIWLWNRVNTVMQQHYRQLLSEETLWNQNSNSNLGFLSCCFGFTAIWGFPDPLKQSNYMSQDDHFPEDWNTRAFHNNVAMLWKPKWPCPQLRRCSKWHRLAPCAIRARAVARIVFNEITQSHWSPGSWITIVVMLMNKYKGST